MSPAERSKLRSGARREPLAGVLLVLLALCFPVGALLQPWLAPSRSNPPVVPRRLNAPALLVTVAGLRADRVGHLGHPGGLTPNLDAMAWHGISYRSTFASSNEAAGSLAALFTSQCGSRNGVRAPGDTLRPKLPTVAERFAQRGFRTAASVADPTLLDTGLQRGFEDFRALPGASAATVAASALEQMDELGDDPWLLWVDFADLRPPYGAAGADPDDRGPGAALSDYDLDAAALVARGWGQPELDEIERRYDRTVAQIDRALGTLLDSLRANGRLDVTLVVVTGSYGERLAERPARTFTRGTDLNAGALHVPLVLRLPGRYLQGYNHRRMSSSLDVGSTLVDICLRTPWPEAQGTSLRAAFALLNRFVMSEGLIQPTRDATARPALSLRLGATRVLLDAGGTPLAAWRTDTDPGEHERLPLQLSQWQALQPDLERAAGNLLPCVPRPAAR